MANNLNLNKIKSHKKVIISLLAVFISVFGILYLLDRNGILSRLFSNYPKIDTSYVLVKAESPEKKVAGDVLLLPSPPLPRDKENPIDGELMTKAEYAELLKNHPIAMTVNNFTSARPQSGLSKADTVMEVLAEGGITRYVAVFYGHYDVAKIGPIRSLRYYMIEFASGYGDAIIAHYGWAGYDGAPFETYREKADARGAVFKWGIKSLQSPVAYYRDMEKAKKDGYVHSVYTDFSRITKALKNYSGWKLGGDIVTPLKFKYDDKESDRGNFQSVTVQFMSLSKNDYTSKFVYDKASNTYKRFIAGREDIDQLTGEQLAPKNVIIEWHNYGDAQDGHSRLIIDMIGSDQAVILRDGKKIAGTWKKECRTCRTKYYDEQGAEIPLVRGQIWIENVIKVGNRKVSNVIYDEGTAN